MHNDEVDPNESAGVALNRQKLDLAPGKLVSRAGVVLRLTEILDFDTAVGVEVESGRSRAVRIAELRPVASADAELQRQSSADLTDIADEDWKIAEQRYAAIKPLVVTQDGGRRAVAERASQVGVDPATIYRWLLRFRAMGVIAALIPRKRGWKTGASRISKHAEAIIQEVIKDTYLTHQRSRPQKVVLEVMRRCEQRGIDAPHANTVRARVGALSERTQLRGRGFKERAKNKFMPAAGTFPHASYPLQVVQIDHTSADIILVDDVHRKPIGRPWITLAIDIHSRMVVGYYLSFDAPSETSVAMCVAHAVLPKDEWLTAHGIDARWDVWGVMDKIHTDNGPDFRSGNFRRSCLMHNIDLEFRPGAQPRYGGHIERMLGTLLREIHDLPGTTFSNIKAREGYDSEKNAVMTKSEFEVWLVTLICKVYHQRLHSAIGMTPARKWEIGMFGNAELPGRGLPPRPGDRHALLLDFLPTYERTIQADGVAIDGINYYADVLRSWINAAEEKDQKKKRLFIFKRDPRDISAVWFYDPDSQLYFKVPFANQALPSMSTWEYSLAKAAARKEGMKSVNESQVLRALTELREKVEESKEKSKKARRLSQRRREHQKNVSPANPSGLHNTTSPAPNIAVTSFAELADDVDAFDDIA